MMKLVLVLCHVLAQLPNALPKDGLVPKPDDLNQQLEDNGNLINILPASVQDRLASQIESQRAAKQTKTGMESTESSSKPSATSKPTAAKPT